MDGWIDGWVKSEVIAQDLPMRSHQWCLKMFLSVEMLSIFINIHLFQYYKNSRRLFPLWVFILPSTIGTGSLIQLRFLKKKRTIFSKDSHQIIRHSNKLKN